MAYKQKSNFTVQVGSEAFADGITLLRAAEEHRLEGVVSKCRDAPYRSGDCRDWRKVNDRVAGGEQGAMSPF